MVIFNSYVKLPEGIIFKLHQKMPGMHGQEETIDTRIAQCRSWFFRGPLLMKKGENHGEPQWVVNDLPELSALDFLEYKKNLFSLQPTPEWTWQWWSPNCFKDGNLWPLAAAEVPLWWRKLGSKLWHGVAQRNSRTKNGHPYAYTHVRNVPFKHTHVHTHTYIQSYLHIHTYYICMISYTYMYIYIYYIIICPHISMHVLYI